MMRFKVKSLARRSLGKLHSYNRLIQTKYKANNDYIWLSLGENCLTDSILDRNYLKSYSSLFASARSNIDYCIAMQNNNYAGLLEEKNTIYEDLSGTKVLRSTLYNESDDIYNELHTNGFEFTHHDWVKNKKLVNTLERRISRTLNYIGKKNFVFLYHHRYTEKSDITVLIQKLRTFQSKFEVNGKKCHVILFYQNIIPKSSKRQVTTKDMGDGIIEFVFHTHDIWEGDNQDIFWARVDDDLIKKMIKESRKLIFQ